MATWSNTPTATLKVKKLNSSTETFTFLGVNSENSAGTPEQFLDAVNRILAIADTQAVLTGMKRTVTQEVNS